MVTFISSVVMGAVLVTAFEAMGIRQMARGLWYPLCFLTGYLSFWALRAVVGVV